METPHCEERSRTAAVDLPRHPAVLRCKRGEAEESLVQFLSTVKDTAPHACRLPGRRESRNGYSEAAEADHVSLSESSLRVTKGATFVGTDWPVAGHDRRSARADESLSSTPQLDMQFLGCDKRQSKSGCKCSRMPSRKPRFTATKFRSIEPRDRGGCPSVQFVQCRSVLGHIHRTCCVSVRDGQAIYRMLPWLRSHNVEYSFEMRKGEGICEQQR